MNKKHGFTLSELLMSIAIIAVVSAMGITIAKRNTDDAYKTYFAVGTMNLNNALAQIESGNVNVRVNNGNLVERTEPVRDQNGNVVLRKVAANPDDDIFTNNLNDPYPNHNNPDNPNVNTPFNNDFRGPMWITNNLRYLFGDTTPKDNNNPCVSNGDCVINASNGITYDITRITPAAPNVLASINITMTVPTPRRRVGNRITDRATTEFLYVRGLDQADLGNQHMLVPLNNENLNADPPLISIQDRQDLLTAYIDDGVVGRHVLNNFMPIRYGTYRDALCSILNQNDSNMNNNPNFTINNGTIVNCSAYNDANGVPHPVATHLSLDNNSNQIVNRDAAGNRIGTAPSSGVIKFASPRKLK